MCLADDKALNDSYKRVFRLAITMSGLRMCFHRNFRLFRLIFWNVSIVLFVSG